METIILTDDQGEEKEFELQDTFGMDEDDYAVFLSLDDESLMYILRIDHTTDGDVYFTSVDDDELEDLIEVYEELLSES